MARPSAHKELDGVRITASWAALAEHAAVVLGT
jgi:hypothetical protein